MKDNFLFLDQETQLEIINSAAIHLNIAADVLYKDIWIVWVLEQLFKLPIDMAFKGGTSLSKVYGLIERFSEDIDLTIDYRNFKPDLNLSMISRSQIKKIGKELQSELADTIKNIVKPYLEKKLTDSFENANFKLMLADNPEQLHFYYPSLQTSKADYLRDHILLEFGIRNTTEPNETKIIDTMLVGTTSAELSLPSARVDVLSPIRTFWEKVTLVHAECHRGRLSATPERLSRHWYDLVKLYDSWVYPAAFDRRDILNQVVEHKTAFFNASYTNYNNCLNNDFYLVPAKKDIKGLEDDYNKMLAAKMFYGNNLDFPEVLEKINNLQTELNQKVLPA